MFKATQPPAYICTLTAEQDARPEPTAFGLMRLTPQMREAIDHAYDELARGRPGEIEIPLTLPVLPARREAALGRSDVPHARALQTALSALTLWSEQRSCAVGDKLCQAFDRLITTRPANAMLIVSRYRAPRIRTCVRGGRTRYVSPPLHQLAPAEWNRRTAPVPLRLVAGEHHRT